MMANVVDELVLRFSLDPTNFNRAQAQTVQAIRQLEADARKSGDAIEASADKIAEGFSRVTKEVLGLGAALLGVNGLKDFVIKTVSAADATGKLSSVLDIQTNQMNVWTNAMRLAGGSAAEAEGSISRLVTTLGRWKTGQAQPGELGLQALGALGIGSENFGDWQAFLLQISGAIKKEPGKWTPGVRSALAQDIPGMSPALMQLLEQGPEKVRAKLAESETLTQQQADSARRISEAVTRLTLAIEKLANKFVLNPTSESILTGGTKVATDLVKGDYEKAAEDAMPLARSWMEGIWPAVKHIPIYGPAFEQIKNAVQGYQAGYKSPFGSPASSGATSDQPFEPASPPTRSGRRGFSGSYTSADVDRDVDARNVGGPGTGKWIAPYLHAPIHPRNAPEGFQRDGGVSNMNNSRTVHIAALNINAPPNVDPRTLAGMFEAAMSEHGAF